MNIKIIINNKNKIFYKKSNLKHELHPIWLRERVNGTKYIDPNNKQRLYENSNIDKNLSIQRVLKTNKKLNITFSDGVKSQFKINNLLKELDKSKITNGPLPKAYFWNSINYHIPLYRFQKKMYEKKKMYKILQDFYKYGFVLIRNVPQKNNYIIKFANSMGVVRETNFGKLFNVISMPKPNDLAYTSMGLSGHTDNPYRKPVPCIQLLHCIQNKAKGGLSTLVDGFAVSEFLKKKNKKYYNILTKTKVRFKFVDTNIILENWGELIELDDDQKTKQIRFSSRLDYVPALNKNKLKVFYDARAYIAKLYSSKKFEIKFKLKSGDLLMMDNHRLLHGRTSYNSKEGKRHLQGCYIDYDSTEGKLRYLERKLNIR